MANIIKPSNIQAAVSAALSVLVVFVLFAGCSSKSVPPGILVVSAAESIPISVQVLEATIKENTEEQIKGQIAPQLTILQNMHKKMEEARKAEQQKVAEQKREQEEKRRQTRGGSTTTVIKVTNEEIKLLEKLVMAEAGGEPYKGQVAVANVVINRVLSKKFPNTVKGVIYQKGQFSPVSSGSIHKKTPSASVKKAVQQALSGTWVVDRNVLYFMTPEAAARTGIGKKHKLATKIGNHNFYY